MTVPNDSTSRALAEATLKKTASGKRAKKILVLGVGQLGQALSETFSLQFTTSPSAFSQPASSQVASSQIIRGVAEGQTVEAIFYGRADLEVTDAQKVECAISTIKPDVVINATAYTKVDQAETDIGQAFAVNHLAVADLGEICARLQVRLIHISTDYVFSGKACYHQKSSEPPAPESVYGASKLAGERALQSVLGLSFVIVRTAWLYSNHGSNFLNTMLRLMSEKDSLSVVSDQVGSPTSAQHLAIVLWKIVLTPDLCGIHHFTNAGVCSWYDFACAIQSQALQLGLLSKPIPIYPIETAQYPTPAARPVCSLLCKRSLLEGSILFEPAFFSEHWQRVLLSVLKQRKEVLSRQALSPV